MEPRFSVVQFYPMNPDAHPTRIYSRREHKIAVIDSVSDRRKFSNFFENLALRIDKTCSASARLILSINFRSFVAFTFDEKEWVG